MSKIEDLIKEYCPDGVEYKELWELTYWDKRFNLIENEKQLNTINFAHISATFLQQIPQKPNGDIRLLSTGNYSGYTIENFIENKKIINQGEVISLPSGGGVVIKYYNGKFIDSGNILAISSNTQKYNLKYIYHFLLNNIPLVQSFYRGAGIQHPNMKKILEIKIPIPPIAIQEEIVNILDSFTELEAELEAELVLRKKQYHYYRDKLLDFGTEQDNIVPWISLDECCDKILAGGDLPKEYLKVQKPQDNMIYPIYSNGKGDSSLYGFTNNYKINKRSVTISARGTIGYHTIRQAYYTPIVRLITLIPDETKIRVDYLNYILDVVNILENYKCGGSIPQLTIPNLKNIKVPVPPLSEQERIVAILDKFDALVNDISIGIPAEINARQQQYKYYRNKLLSFNKI